MFVVFQTLKKPQEVTLGDGHMLKATGSGIVTLELVIPDGTTKKYRLHDVIYVPELSYNLLSVSKMTKVGKNVSSYDSRCQVFDKNERVVAMATEKGNLYYLSCSQSNKCHHINVTGGDAQQSNED